MIKQPDSEPSLPAGTNLIPISFGEMIDRITILEIKEEKISDPAQRANVVAELEIVQNALAPFHQLAEETIVQKHLLRSINERLWSIEDQLRALEQTHDFGHTFVELARSVYLLNDERAALKRRLNHRAGSEIIEEKFFLEAGKRLRSRPQPVPSSGPKVA